MRKKQESKYRDTNTLDRVPSRASPPEWLTTSPKTDPEALAERVAIQAIECGEPTAEESIAHLWAIGFSLLERCPPGTVLYADGRIVRTGRDILPVEQEDASPRRTEAQD